MAVSSPAFGAKGDKQPWELCKTRLARVRDRAQLLDPRTTLAQQEADEYELASFAKVTHLLRMRILAANQREFLLRIRPEHFEGGRIFLVDAAGISYWEWEEYDQWRDYRNHIRYLSGRSTGLTPEFWNLLNGTGSVSGLDDEELSDLRLSFQLAKEARRTTLGMSGKIQLDRQFDSLYDIHIIRGLENGPARMAEHFDPSERRLKLPIQLDPVTKKFEVSRENALNVLNVSVQFNKNKRLVRIDESGAVIPLLGSSQLYFASTFPELIPYLVQANQPIGREFKSLSLANSFEKPDGSFGMHYAMNVGPARPYNLGVGMRFSGFVGDLAELDVGTIGLKTTVSRNFTATNQPGVLVLSVNIIVYDRAGDFRRPLTVQELEKLESALTAMIRPYDGFESMAVNLKPSRVPGANSTYHLTLTGPGANLYHLVNFHLLFEEIKLTTLGEMPH